MQQNEVVRRHWVRLVLSVVLLAGFGGMIGCKTVEEDPHHDHRDFHHDDHFDDHGGHY